MDRVVLRLELGERREQALHVVLRSLDDDVRVLRGPARSLRDSGQPADDDVLDAVASKHSKIAAGSNVVGSATLVPKSRLETLDPPADVLVRFSSDGAMTALSLRATTSRPCSLSARLYRAR